MKLIANPLRESWSEILKRPTLDKLDLDALVQGVFDAVKSEGDKAVIEYTEKFDKVSLTNISVSESEISEGVALVSDELKDAIQLAKKNIETFHSSQKIEKKLIETAPGVECWQESRGIEKVGIYIPGGSAPLFSTVLMLAVPAKLGGCQEVVLCSPPNKEGKLHPAILYAAKLCGVTKIFKVGGIQAIGAMTFGTESVPNVYKIFGPGNQFVTAAKQVALSKGIAIDMPAGPSELLVLADETANATFVASDLLSQAEHGADSQVICVSNSESFLQEVSEEVVKQLLVLPRKEIAEKAIENSKSILLRDKEDIIDLINEYGPEHFILAVDNEDFYLNNIVNAGSVFIGNYTPESAGDYASGTNHTLPTDGFSKSYSGVNLDAFVKKITFQRISKKGIKNIGNAIELMADAEGLQAHKTAVTLRLNELKEDEGGI
ncbi:histidinol dehydrogenase [Urechidicola vernalis]|uniref:Histidinol dehydrogenase n=1 Tax=Urechidicola vernalis TaxID=3075600 RepID=A0ABU2Y3U2_9FLAO|nr:histidinol dehydrogenase [Urechidicola sp. P050]MDT0552874.1 histidinol dehydrogenase [Urechidicola sp. P050]